MARDTTPTDYLGIERPELFTNWAEAWDDLADTVDANLELSGILEDRPSTAPDGARYVVDDPGSEHDGKRFIYRSSTDAWELRPAQVSKLTSDEIEATSASVDSVDSDFSYQVQSGESVQDAMNRADSDGVGRVNVPNGMYDAQVDILRDITVVGSSVNDADITANTSDYVASVGRFCTLKDCQIRQRGSGVSIRVDGEESHVTNVIMNGAGVEFVDVNHAGVTGCYLFGNDITVDSNCNNVLIDGNRRVGTITDNGTNTAVGTNS